VLRAPILRARGEEGAYVKDRRQLLRTDSSPGRSMKQRAIRERRNHKPQDARRFNCRLNCGPTRPSLSRALPIPSLALAALLGQHRSIHTPSDSLPRVCLAHLMHSRSSLSQAEPYPSKRHI
jgi:hypothetical protein